MYPLACDEYLYSGTNMFEANDDAPRFLSALRATANDLNVSVANVLSKSFMIKLLCENADIDVNGQDSERRTALWHAILFTNTNVIDLHQIPPTTR